MRKHSLTILLLVFATVAFVLRFFLAERFLGCCDIVAFALSTLAALVEIVLAEKSSKQTDNQIDALEEKSKKAVYGGETIGRVPKIDNSSLKEELKRKYPDLNP